jgi:uncharacterized protein
MDWTAYWFMFPVALAVATMANATGIEGATFFSPIFILLLRLDPRIAIGTALITALFGVGSGLSAYIRSRLIDYQLAAQLLAVAVPLALVGAFLAGRLSPLLLKALFGVGLSLIGVVFLRSPSTRETKRWDAATRAAVPRARARRRLISAQGEEICYTACNVGEGMAICGVGGLFMGLIGSGQGGMNNYFLLRRCRVPSPVALATGTFVVALTTLAASLGYSISFLHTGATVLAQVLSLVIYTVPGVVLGGQLGPQLATRLERPKLERLLAVTFIFIGGLTLWTILHASLGG